MWWSVRQAIDYTLFYVQAKSPDRLHSPYLYTLLGHVFDMDKAYYAFAAIENLREHYKLIDEELAGTDLGAGSAAGGSNRTIGMFASAALSSPRQCETLFRLTQGLNPRLTIELGSAMGISTAYIAAGNPAGDVISIEGNPQLHHYATESMMSLDHENVRIVLGDFDDVLPDTLVALDRPVDLAFIDGNHRKEATVRYYHLIADHLSADGVIVLDDIRWSREMYTAWCEVSSDPRVRVAVDAFSMGILFFSDKFKDRTDYKITPWRMQGGPLVG